MVNFQVHYSIHIYLSELFLKEEPSLFQFFLLY